ncbi:hypothetical protein BACCIP111899_01579 [Bacillus rhizoplanae]|uniref:Helix-turn-helix domain-containing protein n=1 Tax=Bacillus rhizoplanae TaxID=2880966 RepID=A0ABM8Y9R9_9BACI|nr:helix-turn-helix domain-containing protein [Bacillus rhizoplanae]CAG9612403.1 hypothetical protein BACCIP111899_01579 [Bacillus rhizoplanae]
MQYLREYKTFESVEQLNAAVRGHLYAHNFELNDTDKNILKLIGRYTVKYLGAAHLKAATIAEAIDRSEKTVRRSLNKLQSLGIIRKVRTTRHIMGGYGANIIVINMFDQSPVSSREDADKPRQASAEPAKSSIETITLQSKNNKSHKETVMPADCLRRSMPSAIFNAMSPYFNADGLYKAYGMLLRAKASVDRNIMVEDYENEFVDAFKAVVYALKRGRVRKLNGCLFAAFRQVTIEIKRKLTMKDSPLFYDWLHENY